METETQVVEVPTGEAIAATADATVDAAVAANNAAEVAATAAVAAETAAQEVIEQIEVDEEWLRQQLTEINTQIQALKVETTSLPQSLMVTLSQQTELIRNLVTQITELSLQVTLLKDNQTQQTVSQENAGEGQRVAETTPPEPPAAEPQKKRRKI